MNGNNGCRANTYHHRDESTAIKRACLSEIIGPANSASRTRCDAYDPRLARSAVWRSGVFRSTLRDARPTDRHFSFPSCHMIVVNPAI